jgi:hypothetical protein
MMMTATMTKMTAMTTTPKTIKNKHTTIKQLIMTMMTTVTTTMTTVTTMMTKMTTMTRTPRTMSSRTVTQLKTTINHSINQSISQNGKIDDGDRSNKTKSTTTKSSKPLHALWDKWVARSNGMKPTRLFTALERGRVKHVNGSGRDARRRCNRQGVCGVRREPVCDEEHILSNAERLG